MLTQQQCNLIESSLQEVFEPRRVAAFLSLNMGFTLSEVSALRVRDIDISDGTVNLCTVLGKGEGEAGEKAKCQPAEFPRVLPMPPQVLSFLRGCIGMYADEDCFIMSGDHGVPAVHRIQNLLASLRTKCGIAESISVGDLRGAFIRRCIQSGMDLYSLCYYVGIRQPNVLYKRYEEYFTPHFEMIQALECFDDELSQNNATKEIQAREMNLLIMGAGSQGPVVKEIAEAIGIFNSIKFLDDNKENPLSMGPLSDCTRLAKSFPMAIPSFGDSRLREKYMDLLDSLGYVVPTLIHPSATVSPNAKIERSAVIEARCVVSANTVVGHGAIVSSAAIIEYGARVGKFCHIGSGVTVTKNAVVDDYIRIPAGTII